MISETYYCSHLNGGDLALKIHRAFNFRAQDKYQGRLQIEIKRSDDFFSVLVRTDAKIREFILESGGMTQFVETWPDFNRFEIGSKITSYVYPDLGVAQKSEAADMAFVRKQGPLEWLDGEPRGEEIRKIHEYMMERVLPLLHDYFDDADASPDSSEVLLQKIRREEIIPAAEMKDFLLRRRLSGGRSGPANDL